MSSRQRQQRAAAAPKVLDAATRARRVRKQVEALEQDNAHEDPHANLAKTKNMPKFDFEDEEEEKGAAKEKGKKEKGKKQRSQDYYKKKYGSKSFNRLLEEDVLGDLEGVNYTNAAAPPSKYPARKFCSVCGFPSEYNCPICGGKYCSLKCLNTHKETRCLKWTA